MLHIYGASTTSILEVLIAKVTPLNHFQRFGFHILHDHKSVEWFEKKTLQNSIQFNKLLV